MLTPSARPAATFARKPGSSRRAVSVGERMLAVSTRTSPGGDAVPAPRRAGGRGQMRRRERRALPRLPGRPGGGHPGPAPGPGPGDQAGPAGPVALPQPGAELRQDRGRPSRPPGGGLGRPGRRLPRRAEPVRVPGAARARVAGRLDGARGLDRGRARPEPLRGRDRDLPAQRAHHQGHERAATQARTRSVEGRLEPARVCDGLLDHGARGRARGARSRGARGRGTAAARRVARPGSGALFLLNLRYALGARHMGLARRRPSRLSALHRCQRHDGRQFAVVLRLQPGRSASRAEEGAADPRRGGRRGARAPAIARRVTTTEGDHQRRRPRRYADDGEGEHQPAVADRDRGGHLERGPTRFAHEAD